MNQINSGDGVRVAQPLFPVDGQGSIPMSPLQLRVVEINVRTSIELNKLWHSRIPNIHSSNIYRNSHKICFGAIYKNTYYASAIWTSPVAIDFNNRGFF